MYILNIYKIESNWAVSGALLQTRSVYHQLNSYFYHPVVLKVFIIMKSFLGGFLPLALILTKQEFYSDFELSTSF